MKRTKKVKIYAIGLILGLILMLDVVLALPWGVTCTTKFYVGTYYEAGGWGYGCISDMQCTNGYRDVDMFYQGGGSAGDYVSIRSWCN